MGLGRTAVGHVFADGILRFSDRQLRLALCLFKIKFQQLSKLRTNGTTRIGRKSPEVVIEKYSHRGGRQDDD
ncbi:hypothetical protein GCM10027342_05040 [Photobacterium alginatilyticum]